MSKPKKASAMVILAAVEGGGTSFIVTVAELTKHSNEEINIPYTRFRILHQKSIPSSSPSDVIVNTANFFSLHCPEGGYDALGLATFGPVGVNPQQHETYGRILPGSPKKEWRNVDILSPILKACSTDDGGRQPCYKVDTDVNAPALAEFHYQTNHLKKKMSSLAYVTVGTGVGVGLVINSLPVHGMMHPEGMVERMM
jgi:fructokinase